MASYEVWSGSKTLTYNLLTKVWLGIVWLLKKAISPSSFQNHTTSTLIYVPYGGVIDKTDWLCNVVMLRSFLKRKKYAPTYLFPSPMIVRLTTTVSLSHPIRLKAALPINPLPFALGWNDPTGWVFLGQRSQGFLRQKKGFSSPLSPPTSLNFLLLELECESP